MIAPDDGVTVLQELMTRAEAARVAVLPIDVQALGSAVPALLRGLAEGTAAPGDDNASRNIVSRLRAASPEDRLPVVEAMLAEQVMRVLSPGTDYRPDADRTLLELGMDSLMAIELRNRVTSLLSVTIAVGELMQGPTIHELAKTVLRVMPSTADSAADKWSSAGAASQTKATEGWESGSL